MALLIPTSTAISYVFFLTIGYGDFAPTSPFSRVFFVIYSMISVPIIASFALQTIQSVIGEVIDFRFLQRETKERQRREEFQKLNRDSSLELQDELANDDRIHSHEELVRKVGSTTILLGIFQIDRIPPSPALGRG